MDTLPRLRVQDLATMSADEIRATGHAVLEDGQNLTEELIADLRARLCGPDKSQPVQLDAVDEKLRAFANLKTRKLRRHHEASSGCSSPASTEVATREQLILEQQEDYKALVEAGGRPSHPFDRIEFEFGPAANPADYSEIATYWAPASGVLRSHIMTEQLNHWHYYRQFQDRQRPPHRTSEQFERYAQHVRERRQEKGLAGDTHLLRDRKAQGPLEDWKEYQFYEYRIYDQIDEETAEFHDPYLGHYSHPPSRPGSPMREWEMVEETRRKAREWQKGTRIFRLEKQAFYLRWVDEQLLLVASECGASLADGRRENGAPALSSTENKKMKRSSSESGEGSLSPRKAPRTSCDVTADGATSSTHAVQDARATARGISLEPKPQERATWPVSGVQDASATARGISLEPKPQEEATFPGSGVQDASAIADNMSSEQDLREGQTCSNGDMRDASATTHTILQDEPISSGPAIQGASLTPQEVLPGQKPQDNKTLDVANTTGCKGQETGLADKEKEPMTKIAQSARQLLASLM